MARKATSGMSLSNPLIIGALVVIIAIVGYLFYSSQDTAQQTTTTPSQEISQGSYTLEFVSGSQPGSVYVVVASQTNDVREQLPITLQFLKNGEVVWSGTIEGDPSVICRDQTGCGIDGPNYADLNAGENDTIEVLATDSNGNILTQDTASTQ